MFAGHINRPERAADYIVGDHEEDQTNYQPQSIDGIVADLPGGNCEKDRAHRPTAGGAERSNFAKVRIHSISIKGEGYYILKIHAVNLH